MTAYLGWITAAFLGGILLALRPWTGRTSLQARFAHIDHFPGLRYPEVLNIAGTDPCSIIHQRDGTTLKTWHESRYTLTLCFDARDICLGVMDESFS